MKKLTTEEFIEKAQAIHGDKYDYSKVKYVNSSTDIVIVCPIHGEFPQRPCNHLVGKGCPDCAKPKMVQGRKLSHEDQVAAIYKINPNIKILGKIINNNTPVLCRCVICDHEWSPTPKRLKRGEGCPKCGRLKTAQSHKLSHKDHAVAIAKVNPDIEILGEITNAHEPVLCRCKICNHKWSPTPNKLKQGKGCPKCADHGFNNSKEGCVYLLVDDTELPTCIKVGITNNFGQRLSILRLSTPFPIHVLKVFTFEAGCATRQLEQFAHTVFADRNCHFEGFDGCTEWFWYSHEIVDFLEKNC